MRTNIKKEQAQELRQLLSRLRLPARTINDLLSSQNASNTYKAFRQKQEITTADGWTINFHNKQVTQNKMSKADRVIADKNALDNKHNPLLEQDVSESQTNKDTDALTALERFAQKLEQNTGTHQSGIDVNTIKVSLDVDKSKLLRIKAIAVKKQVPLGHIIRDAIDNYLDQLE